MFDAYATNLYGSNLWDLFGKASERLYKSYNVAIRNILQLDRCTHRYLIEPVSGVMHLKTMLCSRFVSFHNSLKTSSKFPVRFLAAIVENDLRTVHGRNLTEIARQCNVTIDQLKPNIVKKNIRYNDIPEAEKWRVGLCNELISIRDNGDNHLANFDSEELACLLRYVCVA